MTDHPQRDGEASEKSYPSERKNPQFLRLYRFKRQKNTLIIKHTLGGGTEQCVQDYYKKLSTEKMGVFFMQPVVSAGLNTLSVLHTHPEKQDDRALPSLHMLEEADQIVTLWRDLSISSIHLHQLVGLHPLAPSFMYNLFIKAQIPFRIFVHDYYWICPRIHLMDERGFYCGEPDSIGCNHCLKIRGNNPGVEDIIAWRSRHAILLKAAERVIAPNEDVAERLLRYIPEISIEIEPHEKDLPIRSDIQKKGSVGRPLRIATLGGISAIKGLQVLIECSQYAKDHKLPLKFIVIGYTINDQAAHSAGIEVMGPYANEHLLWKIGACHSDAILLPALCPETYSYTLSFALQTHLPIFVFDIGAPAHRLRNVPGSILLPLNLAYNPEFLTTKILEEFSFI